MITLDDIKLYKKTRSLPLSSLQDSRIVKMVRETPDNFWKQIATLRYIEDVIGGMGIDENILSYMTKSL